VRSGYAICLCDQANKVVSWRVSKKKVILDAVKTVQDQALKDMSGSISKAVACFSPSTIYADIGVFTSISEEATQAHIRSTVDNLGLFTSDYSIAFKKLEDIDKIRARFSYLAVPKKDIAKVNLLDAETTTLAILCPIEAALAKAVSMNDDRPAVIIYEDHDNLRIIGSKGSTVFFARTVSKKEAFDPISDIKSNIEETMSFMENEYGEDVANIYRAGIQDTPLESDKPVVPIKVPVVESNSKEVGQYPELVGSIFATDYDFSPVSFLQTRNYKSISAYSMGVSLAMAILGIIFLTFSFINMHNARAYRSMGDVALAQYTEDLNKLEKDYDSFVKENPSSNKQINISRLIIDFENQPKLYNILTDIIRSVPPEVYLKKISIKRPESKQKVASSRLESKESKPKYSTSTRTFNVNIEGRIFGTYRDARKRFLSLVSAIDQVYPGGKADFHYGKSDARFSLALEVRR